MKPTDIMLPLILSMSLGALGSLRADDGSSHPEKPESKSAPKVVGVAEAESLIASKKVLILDVRTPAEFSSGHIAGATNLDYTAPQFRTKVAKLDKGQPYLVYCAVGGRSARASRIMSELNFKSVYDLDGGIKAWEKARKPVVK
jgi:phage shock protein E